MPRQEYISLSRGNNDAFSLVSHHGALAQSDGMIFERQASPQQAAGRRQQTFDAGLVRAAGIFMADFIRYAGLRGARAALLVALGAALDSAGLILLVPLIGIVVAAPADTGTVVRLLAAVGVEGRVARLVVLLLCFTVLAGARALGQWKRDIALAKLRVGFVESRRRRLVDRVAASPWEQLSAMDHARINSLIGNDALLIGGGTYFMLQGAVALCMLACQWGLALALSPVLAGVTAGLMFTSGLALFPQLVRSRTLGRETVEANLELAARGAHFFGGLKLAMSQNLQHRFAREFNQTVGTLLGRQIDFLREQSRAQVTFTILSSLTAATAILLGIAVIHMAPSLLIVFVVLLARMAGPVAQLQQGAQQFTNVLPAYERMQAMESELRSGSQHTDAHGDDISGPIRLCGVSYRHPASRRGVTDLDLVIEAGSFIGVVGPSGSGKSTFADLLVGLHAPQDGMMMVGGQVLSEALRHQWRSRIGYAPQETFLFHDTIRRNLQWSDPDADEMGMREALAAAGAQTVVARLDAGLDSVVGENGILLSGGERQRLAIARALLRRPPLLVLDEATNAIDGTTEHALLARLAALPWHPTIVLLAHRHESLACCDRILTFTEGRIVADERRKTMPVAHPAGGKR